MPKTTKLIIFGQDVDMLVAVFSNLLSWVVRKVMPSQLNRLLPRIEEEDTSATPLSTQTKCIAIGRPGGKEQLRMITLKPGYATCGYNLDHPSPFIDVTGDLPPNTVVVRVKAFSINYADCCIRWGLYESANRFVGWPIVPGFDIAGVVERVADENKGDFQVGDEVFGATFFGAYSTRVLVPCDQIRKTPSGFTPSQAASLPAVCFTALYALLLGGQYPDMAARPSNRSILVHSAAGGVGSMMVQMSKLLGMSPVVGVVGRTAKVEAAKELGCDVVIDKSQEDLWQTAETAAPNGYAVVADANGVSTLSDSYRHLAQAGRLIIFGFHSNLPMGQDMLNPLEWIKMIFKVIRMPAYNPMFLTLESRSVMGFNLSFFVKEMGMLKEMYSQIEDWLKDGKLQCPRVVEMDMADIGQAHELIQSGKSVGKIVMQTNVIQSQGPEQ